MSYLAIKWVHVVLVFTSLAGFVLRWSWMMRGSRLVDHRATRTLPHVLDTLLLASGVALAWLLSANPLEQAWLGIKLLGVVAYIVLAWLAYRRTYSPRRRTVFFIAALVLFAWVISIARLKHPVGFLQEIF